ncbi:3-mercaptopyruvate sulfurtransferase [Sphingosinicella sp. CPCC 101087]|uniref:3-mercaptopyruvate sulfurtransferase n=1 Tax=Sphingosinicella sp. CPCC 101087 TaxID=2497754 RepID=UPI00101C31B8|nr:3-mercaptopyruvate sulfurtransferase [Sphingosinicella sp. CPCC 101087]
MDSLVSTEWLERELGAEDLRIIDASFFLPGSGRDARAEHEQAHVPGALFLDLDEVSDADSPFPHMLPPAHKFVSRMQSLGARDGARFVVYDNSPLHSAARLWWMLRAFGAHHVALLDGGFQKWTAEGRPVESGHKAHRHGHFSARFDETTVASKSDLLQLVDAGSHEIVDARSAERYAGAEPEPRPGLASGHIPGSRNLPQASLFNADNSWKRDEALRAAFDAAGVDLGKPMVTTCGSGVTAAVLLFGAHLLGKQDVRLYDGSWSEWGADPDTPKAKGVA